VERVIYFGRDPYFYGSSIDRWLVGCIQATFISPVKTAKHAHYSDIIKMFDLLYDCDGTVFLPYTQTRFDRHAVDQIRCAFSIGKPVYEISREGHIVRLTSLSNRALM
jgi:hypothetical protein